MLETPETEGVGEIEPIRRASMGFVLLAKVAPVLEKCLKCGLHSIQFVRGRECGWGREEGRLISTKNWELLQRLQELEK